MNWNLFQAAQSRTARNNWKLFQFFGFEGK